MRNFRSILCSTALVAISSSAMAEPATQEGADRLTGLLQSYFSETPGIVTVAPDGEVYRLTVDFNPLTSQIPASEATVSISPLNYELTDNGDGTWIVKTNQPASFKVMAGDDLDMTYNIDSMVSECVWEESLSACSSYKAEMTGISSNSTTTDYSGTQTSSGTTQSMTIEATSVAGANGGIDSVMTGTSTTSTSMMSAPMGPGMPPMDITATVESQSFRLESKGMRNGAMYDLLAFAVANAASGPSAEKQEELRGILQTAMPIFESINGTAETGAITVQTPVGEFGIASAAVEFNMNGGVAEGRFREAIALEGFSMPAGLAPPWAEPLIPTHARFDIEVTNFNLADPLNAMISSFDLTQAEPLGAGFEMQLLSAFLPAGAIDVGVLPTSLSNDTYSINLEGDMSFNVMAGGIPTGKGIVTATGIDKVQELLQSAPPEISGQAAMPLGMATGMAKPGDNGELVWEIDASTPGSLKINGTDLMQGMQ